MISAYPQTRVDKIPGPLVRLTNISTLLNKGLTWTPW